MHGTVSPFAPLILAAALLAAPALAQDSSQLVPVAADLGDADLEQVVRAAYTGASAFAFDHGNYFARDGVFPPLRDAVADTLLRLGFPQVVVPTEPAADLATAKLCRAMPGTELRIVATIFGDGIALVAVTDRRVFVYDYDPHSAADIVITPAADCLQPQ